MAMTPAGTASAPGTKDESIRSCIATADTPSVCAKPPPNPRMALWQTRNESAAGDQRFDAHVIGVFRCRMEVGVAFTGTDVCVGILVSRAPLSHEVHEDIVPKRIVHGH